MLFSCAHVGNTESEHDYRETVDAETWLAHYLNIDEDDGADFYTLADSFDLNEGRDFFDNVREFQIVLLHRVYQRPNDARSGPLLLSPRHKPEAWRTALDRARPKFIFAYGGTNEVSGGYLQEIPDYKMIVYDARKAVYERKPPSNEKRRKTK